MKRFFYIFLIIIILQPIAFANSARPPDLTIVIVNAPSDLEVTFISENKTQEVQKLGKKELKWETYFRLYDGGKGEAGKLVFTSAQKQFEIPLEEGWHKEYESAVSVDYKSGSLFNGLPWYRKWISVSSRVILTLLIEGLIFYLFGYRKKHSWLTFLILNLVTQGVLNFMIGSSYAVGYWIFAFLFFEFLILVIEPIVLAAVLREQTKKKAVGFALIANIVSLVVGIFVLGRLPY